MFNENFLTCHSLHIQAHSHMLSKCFAHKSSKHSQLYPHKTLLGTQIANGKKKKNDIFVGVGGRGGGCRIGGEFE